MARDGKLQNQAIRYERTTGRLVVLIGISELSWPFMHGCKACLTSVSCEGMLNTRRNIRTSESWTKMAHIGEYDRSG